MLRYDAKNMLYVTIYGKICLLLQQQLYDYPIYNSRQTNP